MSDVGPGPPTPAPDQGKPALRDLPGVAAFAAMGVTTATCEALGVLAGLAVDDHWSAAPWGLLVGIVLGSAAAVASVTKLVRRFL